MPIPTLDYEAYSEAGFIWNPPSEKKPLGHWTPPPGADKPGLSAVGSHVYAQHPSTEVLTASYDLCDGRGMRRWRPGRPLPQDLFDHVAAGRPLESHKAMFEREMWNEVCVPKYGWPPLVPHVQRCSMATANVAQYPGALANLGAVLALSKQKDPEGERLIKRLCVPQQPSKKDPRLRVPPPTEEKLAEAVAYIETNRLTSGKQAAGLPQDLADAIEFEFLYRYCDRDVETEMEAADRIPPMTSAELGFWLIDQEVNSRGLGIDRPGLRDCVAVLEQVLVQYGEECRALTGLNVTQLEKLKGWLAAYGLDMPKMDQDHIEAALLRDDLHPSARRVLELRALTGSASVKKTFAIENQCSNDNRLRNLIVHHGARTGRPTGEGPQPLNLPKAGPKLVECECGRPHRVDTPLCPWCGALGTPGRRGSWRTEYVDHVLEVMSFRSLAMVERFFGDAMLAISGCLRGLFVAGEGNDLIASDYSSIEAVVAAMLASEQWRIEAFERNDPIYLVGASKITGKPLQFYLDYFDEHGEHHPDRQKIGKVSELACFTRDTQVLTNRGYVAIVDVTRNDKLWDGVEWVSHQGVVAKGIGETVRLDGVEMTPNHLINLNGSWKAAGQLVSSRQLLCQALATGSANLPWSGTAQNSAGVPCASSALAEPRRTSSHLRTSRKVNRRVVPFAPIRKPGRTGRCIMGTLMWCPTASTAGAFLTASPLALPAANPARPTEHTETTAAGEFAYTSPGRTARPAVGRFSRISSRSPAGMFLPLSSTEFEQTGITNRATCGSLRKKRTSGRAARFPTCKRSSPCTKPVFDIAHAGPRNRFTIRTVSGHLLVHNCGFSGWLNSYKAFGSTEPDDVIKAQILAWRAASPAIVEMWGGQYRGLPWESSRRAELYGLEGMAVAAIQNPGVEYAYRTIRLQVVTDYVDEPNGAVRPCDRLLITLPSGRQLTYHEPKLTPGGGWAKDEQRISYMTWNSNPKYGPMGWTRMDTYGGRIFENVVQAVAHDIQRYGIIMLRLAGYPLVLGVYDEDVVEVPKGFGSIEEVEQIMSTMPPWAYGWPIRAAGGWRGRRYRKG